VTLKSVMTIAVGSMRRPKLEAVREAMARLGPALQIDDAVEIVGVEVPSGVGHTPLSREETMAGARQRARELVEMARQKGEGWRYFVGLEGGLDVVVSSGSRLVFLQNWAYVSDGQTGAYGQSGGVLLPEALARRVVDEGAELAGAIDAFAGEHGIRDGQGAWGILTAGIITRQDAFRVAVLNAFAPFIPNGAYVTQARDATF
jgi:inosine/xanthosine triphosphatase